MSMPGDHYQMDLHVLERDPMGMNRTMSTSNVSFRGDSTPGSDEGGRNEQFTSSPQIGSTLFIISSFYSFGIEFKF